MAMPMTKTGMAYTRIPASRRQAAMPRITANG